MEREKKIFETPEAEVFQYGDQDIITQSGVAPADVVIN